MKRQIIIATLCLLSAFTAHASIPFDSIELIDSAIINSSEISSVEVYLNEENAVIHSIETNSGERINGDLVKKINNFEKSKFKFQIQSVHGGGEGSGG